MQENISRRQNLIDNVLDLSINTGKISEKVDFILYKNEEKSKNKQEIMEIEKDIERCITNLKNIASSLEIKLKI